MHATTPELPPDELPPEDPVLDAGPPLLVEDVPEPVELLPSVVPDDVVAALEPVVPFELPVPLEVAIELAPDEVVVAEALAALVLLDAFVAVDVLGPEELPATPLLEPPEELELSVPELLAPLVPDAAPLLRPVEPEAPLVATPLPPEAPELDPAGVDPPVPVDEAEAWLPVEPADAVVVCPPAPPEVERATHRPEVRSQVPGPAAQSLSLAHLLGNERRQPLPLSRHAVARARRFMGCHPHP